MKKQGFWLLLKSFLGIILFWSPLNTRSFETNHTYLASNLQGIGRPLDRYPTLLTLNTILHNSDQYIHVLLTGLYQKSQKPEKLGRYFGVNNKNTITLADIENSQSDVFLGFVYHFDDPALLSTITLRPTISLWGIQTACLFNLGSYIKGLGVKITLPCIKVSHSLNPQFTYENFNDPLIPSPFLTEKILQGEFSNDEQQQLLSQKLFPGYQEASGLAYVECSLDYHHPSHSSYALYGGVNFNIPTGNKPKSTFLFEPVYGNGGHYGLGWHIGIIKKLFTKSHQSICIYGHLEHRYLFATQQQRTLGVLGMPWGQYYLVGKIDQIDQQLIPAANILKQPLRIAPRNQFHTTTGIMYRRNKGFIGIHYTLNYKETETLLLRDKPFNNATFAVAAAAFDIHNRFGNAPATDFGFKQDNRPSFITTDSSSLLAPQTPASTTHTLACYLGITPLMHRAELSINIALFSDIPSTNSGINAYGAQFNMGISL